MKNLLIVLMMVLAGWSVQGQEKKNKNARHDISVSGNCGMCEKRIEKAALSVSGVKSAEWHSDDQTLHIILNEEKSGVEEVKKAIAKSGHDAGDVKASDGDYSKLHHCCQYERGN